MSIDSDAALGWLTFILRQFSFVAQFCWPLLFFFSAFPSADSLLPRPLRERRPNTNDDALESQEEQLLKNCTRLIKTEMSMVPFLQNQHSSFGALNKILRVFFYN
jgi:hypothetical protein